MFLAIYPTFIPLLSSHFRLFPFSFPGPDFFYRPLLFHSYPSCRSSRPEMDRTWQPGGIKVRGEMSCLPEDVGAPEKEREREKSSQMKVKMSSQRLLRWWLPSASYEKCFNLNYDIETIQILSHISNTIFPVIPLISCSLFPSCWMCCTQPRKERRKRPRVGEE